MKRVSTFILCAAASTLFQVAAAPGAFAAPILGANLATFAVLGATTVTTDPASTIGGGGNVGVWAGSGITGDFNFTAGGSLQPTTQLAKDAQGELDAAILALNSFTPTFVIADGNLDQWQTDHGGVLIAGTYKVSAATTNLAGTLVLDGNGLGNAAQWVFQFTDTLITSQGSDVTVQNVGDGANVGIYWTVGSAATLDGDTFAGNVLANKLISSNGGLTIDCGRLLSAEAAVTLIADKISIGCASGYSSTGGDTTVPPPVGTPVPEPGTLLLLGTGIATLVARRRLSVRG